MAAEYDRLAAADPGRYLVLDAEQPAEDIAGRVWERVNRLQLPVAAS